jgi:ABC-2 type transport system ATP-binding protein
VNGQPGESRESRESSAAAGVSALEARDLSKRYRNVWALRSCSFQLPAGRVTALVGANGAGKSTMMGIAAGLLPATSGELLIGGRAVLSGRTTSASSNPGQRVAILAQDKPLYRDFSVEDMLRFGRSTNRVWDQQRALSWLSRFEIPLSRRCGKLSGGQRAQVALAVALGSRPAVLLLDEPLANLDPVARTEVTGELMGEVAETGMTVVLSTHIVAELTGLGDYLLLLAHGRTVLTGDLDDLLAQHARLSGPRAERPPGPAVVLTAQHTDRQSTFVVRLEPDAGDAAPVAAVAPGWTRQMISLDELVLTYLKASAKPDRALEDVTSGTEANGAAANGNATNGVLA